MGATERKKMRKRAGLRGEMLQQEGFTKQKAVCTSADEGYGGHGNRDGDEKTKFELA